MNKYVYVYLPIYILLFTLYHPVLTQSLYKICMTIINNYTRLEKPQVFCHVIEQTNAQGKIRDKKRKN